MKQLLPWLVIALLLGTTGGAWCSGGSARLEARARADSIVVLQKTAVALIVERDSLATETRWLEIKLEKAVQRAESVTAAREVVTERIGPVVSRDPQKKTVTILIDGEPMMAPAVLLEERELRIQELAAVRTRAGIAETGWDAEKKAHQATKRILENAWLQLELERVRPSLLERVKQEAVKIGGAAAVGLAIGIAIAL